MLYKRAPRRCPYSSSTLPIKPPDLLLLVTILLRMLNRFLTLPDRFASVDESFWSDWDVLSPLLWLDVTLAPELLRLRWSLGLLGEPSMVVWLCRLPKLRLCRWLWVGLPSTLPLVLSPSVI